MSLLLIFLSWPSTFGEKSSDVADQVSCSAELPCRDTNCTSYPNRNYPHYEKCHRVLDPNNQSRRPSPSNTTLDMLDVPAPLLLPGKDVTSDPVSTTLSLWSYYDHRFFIQ